MSDRPGGGTPCGGGLTKTAFGAYLAALNRRDWKACARVYAPSLVVIHHGGAPLDRAAQLASLAARAAQVREVMKLREFAQGVEGVSAVIEIERTALVDSPEAAPELRKGQSMRELDFVFFDVSAGRIREINSTTMERLS